MNSKEMYMNSKTPAFKRKRLDFWVTYGLRCQNTIFEKPDINLLLQMKKEGYILMLEHDRYDIELSKGYFDSNGIEVVFLSYSNEVIQHLQTRQMARNPLPRMILLNANGVPDTGVAVLEQLKSNHTFRQIPTVILCEYPHPDFVSQCYAAGASTVISKPFSDKATDIKINTFIQYWYEVAEMGVTGKSQAI
jgi:CheY-like chemotaxis protein